jgi:hypothetical protein
MGKRTKSTVNKQNADKIMQNLSLICFFFAIEKASIRLIETDGLPHPITCWLFTESIGLFWGILERWQHASENLQPQVFFVAKSVAGF